MMAHLQFDMPLELPLPRRIESSSAGRHLEEASFLSPEGAVSPVSSHYDPNRGVPCKLFVGGVSAHTTTEALRSHFSKYGRVIDAVVMQKNGRPRGFGFVTFDHPMPAECVLAEAQWLDGRLVDVKRAVPGERAQERASNKIFVGGLPQDVSTDELRGYFTGYGPVADAVVMVDRRTNRSRGFGFVRFGNGVQGNAASEAVLMDFQSHRLAGKWVEVKRATPASQLQEMFLGEGFEEEMASYGMTTDDLMAAAAMGMPLHDYIHGMAGWDSSPCGESTPLSSQAAMDDSTAGSTRSHARGRRARRRKQREQKPGSNDDAEDYSDDDTSPTASISMPDTLHGDVAFITTSNSCSTTASPTAAASLDTPMSGWGGLSEARAPGFVLADRSSAPMPGSNGQRQRVPSGGGKSTRGSPIASENDPARANLSKANKTPSNQPMKVFGDFTCEIAQDFTRDDFLSLEVGRPCLSSW